MEKLLFDGWEEEELATETELQAFVDGFAPIGESEEDPNYFTSVRVYATLSEDKKSVKIKEMAPWYEGMQVVTTSVPADLEARIRLLVKEQPVPVLKTT